MPDTCRAHNHRNEASAERRYGGSMLVHFPAIRFVQPVLQTLYGVDAASYALNGLKSEAVNNYHVVVSLYCRLPREPHYNITWHRPAACSLFDFRDEVGTIELVAWVGGPLAPLY